jgi:signal transduction histidine kinase
MRRYVEYHLAHARAAASGAVLHARSDVLETVDGLVRTMHQLHADRGLSIVVHVDPRHQFKGRREDLAEMIGNVLDNACKWARMRVSIASSLTESRLLIAIEDDGPGLDAEASHLVLERGVRRDERVPGSGLGLAIVRDLAELYGGSIALERASAGGVSASVELPGEYAESHGHLADPGV